jgi:hypothetical protein
MYRGCMIYLFACLIAIFSAALGRTYGLAGMIAPWIVVGIAYFCVDAVLGGVSTLLDEWDARP